jgi:hypothetical protein
MASGFFPPGILSTHPDDAELLDDFFAQHLRSMGELPLAPAAADRPLTIRFLALPCWHSPYVVRVEHREKRWQLTGRMTDGDGGSYAGEEVTRTAAGRLTGGEARRLAALLVGLSLWEVPTTIGEDRDHGMIWVLEASEAGRYHVAYRWSPETWALAGAFGELCWFLGALGGFHAGEA